MHPLTQYECCVAFAGFSFKLVPYFKFQDDQPDVQGLAVLLSSERYATNSPIGM